MSMPFTFSGDGDSIVFNPEQIVSIQGKDRRFTVTLTNGPAVDFRTNVTIEQFVDAWLKALKEPR